MQQKILWAEAQKETGKRKSRWKIRDLLADGRCGQAVLDFLTSTDVGRLAPPLEKSDTGSQVSEWELRERRERQEEREAEAEERGGAGQLGAGEGLPLFLPTPPFMVSAGRSRGRVALFLGPFLCSFLNLLSLGTGLGGRQRGACNAPPPRGLRTGKPGKMYAAMIYIGRMRVWLNKNKKL